MHFNALFVFTNTCWMEEDSKLEATPRLGIFLVNVLIETFLKHTVPSQPVNLFLLVTFTNKIKLPVSYLEVLCQEQLSFLPHGCNLVFKIISRCVFASLSCGGGGGGASGVLEYLLSGVFPQQTCEHIRPSTSHSLSPSVAGSSVCWPPHWTFALTTSPKILVGLWLHFMTSWI